MEYRYTIIIADNLDKISILLNSGTYFINNANPIKLPKIGNIYLQNNNPVLNNLTTQRKFSFFIPHSFPRSNITS